MLESIVKALVSVVGGLYRRIDALEEENRGMAMRASELEARKALVDMGGDHGRERARADREAGDREKAADAGDRAAAEAEAAREDMLCNLATARAQVEMPAAERPARAAACANYPMSRPDLAVSTALSARRLARQRAPVRTAAAACARARNRGPRRRRARRQRRQRRPPRCTPAA